ncbi:transketolase [Amycolatopsis arida]|uniref:Transketolase n=1 Tax=Amycolatopsis arida TaxID=587909 RepID=A0A1I5XVF4_9PSEU|nr:thiamine pyrophosphate-dependent enzyme [Amycolatopsis arida]TDX97242.1 transketolase [Amycolatopsis arida]SFQ35928.1 transketolase [Amycolatopsis arida]
MTNATLTPGMASGHWDYDDLPALIARMTGDEKHAAAAESTLDALWVLYDRVLNVAPDTVDDPDRDRFLLSKGHGPMAYYAVLTAKGFLDPDELAGWASARSRLGQHPDRVLVPGVEISSGSLGHGLPIAVGVALGLRAQHRGTPRVVVLVGDAELDEGSNSEAIVLAGRAGLDRLTTVAIDNSSATHGWPGGLARRFEVEGWATHTVDGRDHDGLYAAFTEPHPGRPLAVVAVVEPEEDLS